MKWKDKAAVIYNKWLQYFQFSNVLCYVSKENNIRIYI